VSLGRAFGVSFTKYLSAYGLQVTNQVKDECINNFVGTYPGLTYQKLLKPQYQDIYQNQDVVRINDELIMTRTGTPRGPLFIGVGDADGTGDGVMVTKDDEGLAHTYCERGVSVEFHIYSGDDHTNAAIPFEAGALTFLTDRLNGVPVQNGCSSVGAGNALTPLPIPPNPPSLKLADLGASKHLHGVVLALSSTGGTLANLIVTVRRGGKLIERFRVARVTGARHRLVLRAHGRIPRRGRYTVLVSQDGLTLLTRTIRVR
jgi:Secretory lipase